MTPPLLRQELVSSAAATDWGAPGTESAGGLARVLYAEDDPLLRRLGKQVLARQGYTVDAVEDGAAAWLALNERNYHLLVTDHDMPRLTGLELVTRMRQNGMRLPIIMTSGSFNPLLDLSGAVPGLNAFLPKPYTLEMLSAIVAETLHAANSRNPLQGLGPCHWAQPTGSQPTRPYGGLNE